jgi:hypothetical protein
VFLPMQDINALLDRLVYDGKIEVLVCTKEDGKMYKASNGSVVGNAWTVAPCGTCPAFKFCKE